MFLVNNVEDINLAVFGYEYGSSFDSTAAGALWKLLIDFRAYVNEHFESTGDHYWLRLIRFHSAGDKHSIELFTQLFEDFIRLKLNATTMPDQ